MEGAKRVCFKKMGEYLDLEVESQTTYGNSEVAATEGELAGTGGFLDMLRSGGDEGPQSPSPKH